MLSTPQKKAFFIQLYPKMTVPKGKGKFNKNNQKFWQIPNLGATDGETVVLLMFTPLKIPRKGS